MFKTRGLKRVLLGVGTFGFIIAGAAAFSAFEAHVINVTARIENALFVHPEAMEFGTVFPQEHLESSFFITTSESFSERTQTRVGKIDYVIKQKPKPRVDTSAEREFCHDNWPPADIGDPDDPYYDRCYPFLGPYLSKKPDGIPSTGPNANNDTGVPAFHDPFDPSSFAHGTIVKLPTRFNDPADIWTIDLAVPCFRGFCAQDWDEFVHEHNPLADPDEFMLDPRLEHEVFGADLWVEVTRIY